MKELWIECEKCGNDFDMNSVEVTENSFLAYVGEIDGICDACLLELDMDAWAVEMRELLHTQLQEAVRYGLAPPAELKQLLQALVMEVEL